MTYSKSQPIYLTRKKIEPDLILIKVLSKKCCQTLVSSTHSLQIPFQICKSDDCDVEIISLQHVIDKDANITWNHKPLQLLVRSFHIHFNNNPLFCKDNDLVAKPPLFQGKKITSNETLAMKAPASFPLQRNLRICFSSDNHTLSGIAKRDI